MAPIPHQPEDEGDATGPLERTVRLDGDPPTLAQEIERAKQQAACLIIIRGKLQGHRHFLTREETIIGRDPAADICLSDEGVSRWHAQLTRRGGAVLISDLGSANGTYVNEQRVTAVGLPLAKEDMVRIGTSILKFLPAGELEIILYGNLATAAHTDPLTRIYNKGYLLEALGAEWKRARALRAELSLIFLDLDHFKKVNDTFGHDAGDYVLREMTRLVRSALLAPRHIFARYGGEEFAILLGNTGASHAQELAERVRAAVESHAFVYEDARLQVTCSIGVATLQPGIDSAAALLRAADMAGYASKRNGRNRVTMAEPPTIGPASD
jgi:diguanylate cyclase (GGDEF)-like protein